MHVRNFFHPFKSWPKLAAGIALLGIGILLGLGIAVYSLILSHAVSPADNPPNHFPSVFTDFTFLFPR